MPALSVRSATVPSAAQNRHKQSIQVRLEERDIALLCDLYLYGAMLRGQIQALFFPSLRGCNRRLKQLSDAGYITGLPLPLGPQSALHSSFQERGAGGQRVYRLTAAAAPLAAARLGCDTEVVRRALGAATPTFLAHTLEIVSFRLALSSAAASTRGIRLVQFLSERQVRHSYEVRARGEGARPWRLEVFKPDALAKLSFAPLPDPAFFFVEIDLGHTSAKEFAVKLRLHRRYEQSGLFTRRYGAPAFTTLVCTTGPLRRDHLRRIAEAEGASRCHLATFSDLAGLGPLAAVWHAPNRPGPVTLEAAAATG